MTRRCECSPDCPVEWGRCHCGCGGRTQPADRTSTAQGYVKGEPVSFIRGHYQRLHPPNERALPKPKQLTIAEREQHALARVKSARAACLAEPLNAALRLTLEARCEERDAIRRVMERSA